MKLKEKPKFQQSLDFLCLTKVLWLTAWYYYNHQNEFQSDIGEDEDGNAILTRLIGHLQGHLELSKTNATAKEVFLKQSAKPMVFINKLLAWKRGFVWYCRVSIVLRLVLASCDCVAYK